MIRYSPLLDNAEFRIGRFDHPLEHSHHDPAIEVSDGYSVSRVEHGSFRVEIGRRSWDLGPGDLFLNHPGMEYRCRHKDPVPRDQCLSIAWVSGANPSEETVGFERVARTQPVFPANNRLSYLFLRLASNEQMATEEAASEVIEDICCRSDSTRPMYRHRQLTWYAERVDAVRSQIDQHYASMNTLGGLARSVGMSPFHFARIFRELVGVPPHSYLRRTRLKQAARNLREGASVTEACFSSGFQNLSHFSRQFHRHFGVKPSEYPCKVKH